MLQLTNADVGFASGAKSANLHPKIEHFRRPDDDTLARIIQPSCPPDPSRKRSEANDQISLNLANFDQQLLVLAGADSCILKAL